jgi:protein-disulfide isomerase
MRRLLLLIVLCAALRPGLLRADQPGSLPECAALDAGELVRAADLMATSYLYDCCDDTIAACLAAADPCPLARRLAAEVCRRVGRGEDNAAVGRALRLRARSMLPVGAPASIALDRVPAVGAPAAAVVVVEYACLRCPFCSTLTPELAREVTAGRLAGKARLYFKGFPIKGHEGSTEGGLAALAAHEQGLFWEFLAIAYDRFDSFAVEALPCWAEEVGADPGAWQAAVDHPATREALVAAKREGMANGVDATPTFFIAGRRYHGELSIEQLVDVILEEHERLTSAKGTQ